jgi:hypothetical protein
MNIADGSSAEVEIAAFLVKYEAMKRRWQAEGVTDLKLDFFKNCKCIYF